MLWSRLFSKTACNNLSLPTRGMTLTLPSLIDGFKFPPFEFGQACDHREGDFQGLAIKGNTASTWLPWSTCSWNPATML